GLLALNFRFLDFAEGLTPVTYTASQDSEFPDAPVLGFENGIPTQFSFQVISGNNGLMFADPKAFFFFLQNGTIGGDGSVTLEINESPPPTVPENTSPLASLLAFLGLGAAHLWKKSRKS
ncbi:MAG: hypothetical protein ACM37W_15560, partial [Actinomycetota bacterium]